MSTDMADRQYTERRRREATRWFVTLQQDDLSAQTLTRWKRWESVPENREAFDAVERVWQLAGELSPMPEPAAHERAADHYDGSMAVRSWQTHQVATARFRPRVMGLAAAILLTVAALPWLILQYVGTASSGGHHMSAETNVAEHKELVLEDGTRLHLGAQTRVTTHFTKHARTVTLHRGEALFEVAKDRTRPFRVDAGRGNITAVGTAFGVSRADPNETLVTVREGVVEIVTRWHESVRSSDDISQPIVLRAGEQLHISGRGAPAITRVDVQNALSWVGGWLVFDTETVAQAVHQFNVRNQLQIAIMDSALGQQPVRGMFKIDDPAGFAAFLQRNRAATVISPPGGPLLLVSYQENTARDPKRTK